MTSLLRTCCTGLLALTSTALVAAAAAVGPIANTLSPAEVRGGWRLLWDGRTSAGWRGAGMADFPQRGWLMQDGVLKIPAGEGVMGAGGGDIVTVDTFADFELVADFKLTPGAKSGIKYFVDPAATPGPAASLGLQYHLVDDATNPDARGGTNGNRTLASVYDLVPAAATKPARPVGEWNTARIVSRGGHVEQWLNGEKVLEFDRFGAAFRAQIAASKYAGISGFGLAPAGRILLQDHGYEVSYRNLKIRPLSPPATR